MRRITPNDGHTYRVVHNEEVQDKRRLTLLPCGPRGTIHDYVPFYFGYLSPMLLNLKTGRVPGYTEEQRPLIYLVSNAQAVQESGNGFVFSDGHGLAMFTNWYSDLAHLDKVDWSVVYERYWKDTNEDLDRQRRKQAEFLVYRFCDWGLIEEIAVIDQAMQIQVQGILQQFPADLHKPVVIKPEWYYY